MHDIESTLKVQHKYSLAKNNSNLQGGDLHDLLMAPRQT